MRASKQERLIFVNELNIKLNSNTNKVKNVESIKKIAEMWNHRKCGNESRPAGSNRWRLPDSVEYEFETVEAR